MAILTVAAARQRIAAALSAIPGWHESRWAYDLFPLDPGQYAHLSFAVGAPNTLPTSPIELYAAKRGAAGGECHTMIGIRFTARIRADRQVGDFDSALASEAAALIAVGAAAATDCHFLPEELRRQVVGDGTWFLGEIMIRATHRIALV